MASSMETQNVSFRQWSPEFVDEQVKIYNAIVSRYPGGRKITAKTIRRQYEVGLRKPSDTLIAVLNNNEVIGYCNSRWAERTDRHEVYISYPWMRTEFLDTEIQHELFRRLMDYQFKRGARLFSQYIRDDWEDMIRFFLKEGFKLGKRFPVYKFDLTRHSKIEFEVHDKRRLKNVMIDPTQIDDNMAQKIARLTEKDPKITMPWNATAIKKNLTCKEFETILISAAVNADSPQKELLGVIVAIIEHERAYIAGCAILDGSLEIENFILNHLIQEFKKLNVKSIQIMFSPNSLRLEDYANRGFYEDFHTLYLMKTVQRKIRI